MPEQTWLERVCRCVRGEHGFARLTSIVATVAGVAVAAVVAPPQASAEERMITYTVGTKGIVHGDVTLLRTAADQALNDARGWSLGGAMSFQAVGAGGQLRIVLASPTVVAAADPVCSARYSCRVGDDVYINDTNWRQATASWTSSLADYQRYVVMHEVGHWLGLRHSSCTTAGQPAAVMQQQSKALDGCLPNVWPLTAELEAVARFQGVSRRSFTSPTDTPPEPSVPALSSCADRGCGTAAPRSRTTTALDVLMESLVWRPGRNSDT